MGTMIDRQITRLAMEQDAITPFNPGQVQPVSYDLTLANKLCACVNDDNRPGHEGFRDAMTGEEHGCHNQGHEVEWFDMRPGDFLLACTQEYVKLPADVVGRVEGKSTMGRIGTLVHVSAGLIDPGFEGNITLELKNESLQVVRLHRGQRIGQLVFEQLSEPCEHPYGSDRLNSHYQGQTGATPARINHTPEVTWEALGKHLGSECGATPARLAH